MPLWVDIAVGTAASATALSIVGTFGVRLASNKLRNTVSAVVQEHLKPNNEATEAMKLELSRQFGGNSGGMRQAINELATEVAYVKGALGLPPKEASHH